MFCSACTALTFGNLLLWTGHFTSNATLYIVIVVVAAVAFCCHQYLVVSAFFYSGENHLTKALC